MKEANISHPFQGAFSKGKRGTDHIFVAKTLIDQAQHFHTPSTQPSLICKRRMTVSTDLSCSVKWSCPDWNPFLSTGGKYVRPGIILLAKGWQQARPILHHKRGTQAGGPPIPPPLQSLHSGLGVRIQDGLWPTVPHRHSDTFHPVCRWYLQFFHITARDSKLHQHHSPVLPGKQTQRQHTQVVLHSLQHIKLQPPTHHHWR